MNRELKFRVWDKVNLAFVAKDSPYLADMILICLGFKTGLCVAKSDLVIQQYTGIKDQNGTEIYEGDICVGMHDFGPGGFHERTFTVGWHNERGYQWEYWDLTSLEIIGNIFENKELK